MGQYNLIFSRYISLAVLFNFFLILILISIVLIGNQFFLVISQSATESFFLSELLPIVFLKYIRDVPFIIVLSFVLSITHTLSKLYKNSELIVVSNAGIGDLELYKILFKLILSIFFIVTFISNFITPAANNRLSSIKEEAKFRPDYIFFREGVFQSFQNKDITFYSARINNISGNQFLKDIFIISKKLNKVILAKNGRKFIDEELQNVYLRLYDGQIYQNLDEGDNKNLSISNFKVFDIMIYDPSSSRKTIIPSLNDKNSNTSFLYDLKNLNELVYRLSISLSLLIISIISIQISRTNFRKARNYAVGAGFLSYIIYYNLIIYVKELRFESFLEIFSNNLLPHLIFLIYFLFIYIFRNNLRFKQ